MEAIDPHRALIAYLDSVAPWFPLGVPEAVPPAGTATANTSIALVALSWPAAPWENPAGVLLKAAVEKGLRRTVADVNLVGSEGGKDSVIARLQAIKPRVAILLGGAVSAALLGTSLEESRRRWHNLGGVPAVVVLDPAAVVTDPASKRDLWEDLKPVLARLSS